MMKKLSSSNKELILVLFLAFFVVFCVSHFGDVELLLGTYKGKTRR